MTTSIIRGTAGDDNLSGTSGNDRFLLWQGGNDTVDAGDGNDSFYMGAALNAGDKLDGGTGKDVIVLNGDYSAGVAFNADTITNIEVMALVAGHSYNLTTNDGNVAAGQMLLVRGDTLGSGNTLTFDGSAELDGKFTIIGGAGNDTLTGGNRHDVFDLSHGGNDTVHGGGGTDTFNMGAAFTIADVIDGGAGNDTLVLDGDYNLSDPNFVNVETVRFVAGHNYNVSFADASVAAGATLTVDASALGAGDSLSWSGQTETNGAFHVIAGAGGNDFRGGSGNDVFDLTQGHADAFIGGGAGNDTFNVGANFANYTTFTLSGGIGTDTLNFDGAYAATIALTSAHENGMDTLHFAVGHSYTAAVTGQISDSALTVDGSALGASDSLSIDLSAETATATIIGGAGNDTVIGSAWAMTMTGGLGADTFTGGSGADTFVYASGQESNGIVFDKINDFTAGTDKFDLGSVNFQFEFTTDQNNGLLNTDLDVAILRWAPLSAHFAFVVDFVNSDFAGRSFLVVDSNGNSQYDAGTDLVVEVTGHTGTIFGSDFI